MPGRRRAGFCPAKTEAADASRPAKAATATSSSGPSERASERAASRVSPNSREMLGLSSSSRAMLAGVAAASNEAICCSTPSSSTRKSSRARPRTRVPSGAMTVQPTSTSSTRARIIGTLEGASAPSGGIDGRASSSPVAGVALEFDAAIEHSFSGQALFLREQQRRDQGHCRGQRDCQNQSLRRGAPRLVDFSSGRSRLVHGARRRPRLRTLRGRNRAQVC